MFTLADSHTEVSILSDLTANVPGKGCSDNSVSINKISRKPSYYRFLPPAGIFGISKIANRSSYTS